MSKEERFKRIIDYIEVYGQVSSQQVQSINNCHRNTATNDLSELVAQGILLSFGSTKSTIYKLKESLIFKITETTTIKNLKVKIDKYINNKNRKSIGFNSAVEKALSADFGFDKETEDAFFNSVHKIAEKKQKLNESERKRRKEKLVIDLAWASSRIEGNTYSLLETEALIKYNETSSGKSIQEAQMILNHKKALEYTRAYPENFVFLTKKHIYELHEILIKELDVPGGIRDRLVRISNSSFIPCDNRFQIEESLEKIIDLINKQKSILDKAIAANLLIAFLQPFEDGNKRSSRMLGNSILIANHFLPISFSHTAKEDYITAILYFYEKQDPEFFKYLFLNELNQSFIEYME